jgi:hypothetical protein
MHVGQVIPALSENLQSLLLASVRKLLFNIVKHAGENTARVEARTGAERELRLVVIDEGAGFDLGRIKQPGRDGHGFGLFSIKERLELMGAGVEIESAPLTTDVLDPVEQRPRIEGLLQDVCHAELPGISFRLLRRCGGHHHDGNRGRPGPGPQVTDELDAVHLGHHHIGQDDVRLDCGQARQRLAAVGGLVDAESRLLEHAGVEAAEIAGIFDDEYSHDTVTAGFFVTHLPRADGTRESRVAGP